MTNVALFPRKQNFLLVICSRSAIILTVLETRYVYVENYAQSSKKTICGRLKQSDIVNINNLLIGDLNICLGIDSLCLPTSYFYIYFEPTYFGFSYTRTSINEICYIGK